MCEHLAPLLQYLSARGIRETWRGQAWTENSREWVYFDCILVPAQLKARLGLSDLVKPHECVDYKLGYELGLECTACHDAVVGLHPDAPDHTGKIRVA